MRPTKIFDTRMIVSLVIAWNQEKSLITISRIYWVTVRLLKIIVESFSSLLLLLLLLHVCISLVLQHFIYKERGMHERW